ncbi:MAG: hypothetical protein KIS91_14445 [Anaerolineae bacterium]|nr:hypothetical protein [Anaerolineae bacterium]
MLHLSTATGQWRIVAWWTLASLVGWAAGLALAGVLTGVLSRLDGLNEDRALIYAALLSLGIALGVAQWPVMRVYLPAAWRWVAVTIAGYLLAILVPVALSSVRLVGMEPLLFALMGAAVGLPQAWLLWQYYQGAALWVLASALTFLGFLWLVAHPVSSQGEMIVMGGILGALGALATGVTLAWLAQRPRAADGSVV